VDLSDYQNTSLRYALVLVRAGVPVFLARPDARRPTGYAEPAGWQRATPRESVVYAWRPGMALCAVMGHALDLIDLDPRSGGELPTLGSISTVATADTPSDGRHLFVAPLGLASRDGVWPGVDYKGGAPDGSGRGYAFIAPTLRVSKVDGTPRPYYWTSPPNPERIRDAQSLRHERVAGGLAELRQRVLDLRSPRVNSDAPRRILRSAARSEWARALITLTEDVRRWAASGWGGQAHAGLLAATTHLARLSPEHAEAAVLSCFAAAGVEPDDDDLKKLDSAIEACVPDVVLDDTELLHADPDAYQQMRFWQGGEDPEALADQVASARIRRAGWSDMDAYRISVARRGRDRGPQ
jgi:hypothetical protein